MSVTERFKAWQELEENLEQIKEDSRKMSDALTAELRERVRVAWQELEEKLGSMEEE